MQKVLAAALAGPVIVLIVARSLGRRAGISRLAAVAAVLAVGAILAASTSRLTPATALPPSRVTALDATEFTTEIRTSESPSAPITISFPTSMNGSSVERMLTVTPATAVDFTWDTTGSLLTVSPRTAWRPGTYYTVTVAAGTLDSTGRPLERRIRAAFLTRPPVTATIVPTALAGDEATIGTVFRVAFSGPVDESSLEVVVSPATEGVLVPVGEASVNAPVFEFVPDEPLRPDTEYTVTLGRGTRDVDGAAVEAAPVVVRTAAAPAVVRFRPRDGWADVTWSQNLSVRFTEPMDRATTEAAWTALEGTVTLKGTFSWAERDTVLVFDPAAPLGYSQTVTMTVGSGATSMAGIPLQAAASASFTTAARPAPPAPAAPRTSSSGGGSSGGGSVGAATWGAVESYYLGLMNCTRTGGLVSSTGSCSGAGSRDVAALWQDDGISSSVSRPYAKLLAVNNLCTHFSGGTPGDRLRAAGYPSYVWAENLGCRSGDPYASVLGTHLFYQSEQPYNGGHYVNLMNAKYDRVGIGVWVAAGRVRLVVDFYRPL